MELLLKKFKEGVMWIIFIWIMVCCLLFFAAFLSEDTENVLLVLSFIVSLISAVSLSAIALIFYNWAKIDITLRGEE